MNAALNDPTVGLVRLDADITHVGTVTATRVVNLDLGGFVLKSDLKFDTSTHFGTIILSNGTLDGDLEIDTVNASFVNNATVTGTTTITNVAPATFTNNGTLGSVTIADADGTRFVQGAGANVGDITVATSGAVILEGVLPTVKVTGNPIITNRGTIAELEAQGTVTLVNQGTVTDLSGTGDVNLSGSGEVTGTTNNNVVKSDEQDSLLTKVGELSESAGVYSTSFTWSSENGIGTKDAKESGAYKYYSDGAFLKFNVVDENDNVLNFNEVFKTYDDRNNANGGMTLQTNDGTVNDMDGSNRELADWGDSSKSGFKTNLPGDKSLFYGVIQHADYGTKTVGFKSNEDRTIHMTLEPKADLAPGKYTVTVEAVQQTTNTSGGTITYEIDVPTPQ